MGYERDITEALAVFSDEFQFPGANINADVPGYIEADRLVMAARPGMLRKLLPLRVSPEGVFCGGTYAFSTREEAEAYAHWCTYEFKLDGETLFLDRPEFLEPRAQLWDVAGIGDFGPTEGQKIMRVERWHALQAPSLSQLRDEWLPRVIEQAQAQGIQSAWLLLGTDPIHPQIGLVTSYDADTSSANQGSASHEITNVESRPSLLAGIEDAFAATKVFDRTSWIYMIWHPVEDGDANPLAAEWPISPPVYGLSK